MSTSTVPADLSQFVDDEIASGRFADLDAVIAHALRLLQRDREEAIRGVELGLEDAAAGRMQPLSAAFAELRHRTSAANAT